MTIKTGEIIPTERIQQCIYLVRRQKVMLDSDLAKLYGVETGALVRAVKRNTNRFPPDFMFQLTQEKYDSFLRCQIGTSNKGRGGRRYLPYAFTEQGVAMLSSVLTSHRAIEVNIAIVRTFVKLREIPADNALFPPLSSAADSRLQAAPAIRGKTGRKKVEPVCGSGTINVSVEAMAVL